MRFNRFVSLFLLIVFLIASCSTDVPPEPDSDAYKKAVSDFYISLAASQTDEMLFAIRKMNEVVRSYPDEAAAWANLGVFAMRQGNFELASERLSKARELAPGFADIFYLSGMMESRRGRMDEAIALYRKAAEFSPDNARIQFSLLTELERKDSASLADEIQALLNNLLELFPENQVLWLEKARVAARERNQQLIIELLNSMSRFEPLWPGQGREQRAYLVSLAEEGEFLEIIPELAFFRNIIEPTPEFQADLQFVQFPPTEIGFLVTEFVWLPQPQIVAAEPDMELEFIHDLPEDLPAGTDLIKAVTLLEEAPPFTVYFREGVLVVDEYTRLPFPGGDSSEISPVMMAEIDFNYNFRNDIALAGPHGFRFYRHEDDRSFTDITETLGLSNRILNQSYNGVWTADVDLDGDLDLILSPAGDEPFALINRTNGTFGVERLFSGVSDVIDIKWADLDGTGAADALFHTSSGAVHLYQNLRSNEFVPHPGFPEVGNAATVAVGDVSASGYFDIITAGEDGVISVLAYNQRHNRWESKVILDTEDSWEPGKTSFFVVDFDNNGSLDLLISDVEKTRIWLGNGNQVFNALEMESFGRVISVYDINGNERLDLTGIDNQGQPFNRMNTGTKPYNAYSIRARASGLEGDQRINSFGIGGEIEVRSGLLYQKQLISSPIVHFGLGEYEEVEMLRIIWPNGSVQAEFAELGLGPTIFNEQILKGSCPWLFTSDGNNIHFITDILWRSPLGLRINAQETAGVIQTLDRVRIPGELLQETDGYYDVRITAELWETHFFDYVGLVAVDHPENTEMFLDERFVFPAPDLSAKLMSMPEPVEKVTDEHGNDLTKIVSQTDGNYIAPFRKTAYQGLVEEHFIEIELNDTLQDSTPQWLVAHGWLRPTDSSINLALSQGDHQPPSGLHIKVADGTGGWQTLHANYGFPAGKVKTILLDLEDAFPDSSDRRLRFYTTSEIYWDSILLADKMPSSDMKKTDLNPIYMELMYRGFSTWTRADSISPKLPDYAEISSTAQRWRDLEGYHTRFGDVSELLAEIDDRYVIMNAGDEMRLKFDSPGEVPPGFQRSFILISDGWVKDGDYNTEASQTVLPLPYHGMADYDYSRDAVLLDDPVYQRNREDWIDYHTRYVTPESFRTALIFEQNVD